MNYDKIYLPKIPKNISELQKELSPKNICPLLQGQPSNININKIIKKCLYKKSKSKLIS